MTTHETGVRCDGCGEPRAEYTLRYCEPCLTPHPDRKGVTETMGEVIAHLVGEAGVCMVCRSENCQYATLKGWA